MPNPTDKLKSLPKRDLGIHSVQENLTGASYDSKAKAYEKMVGSRLYNNLMWGTSPADYIEFSKKAIIKSQGTGLDIGCGGLIQTSEQYRRTTNEMILLDNSMEMLKVGHSRLTISGELNENLHLLQADAFNLPFDDHSFDFVCSFGVVHIFDQKQALIQEALRVLKPGGSFFFTALTTDRYISRKYMSLLRRQGEFGTPMTASEYVDLFDETKSLEHYTKGSMVFIEGKS